MNRLRSCILTYHSIDDSGSVISVSPATFRAQMSLLAKSGVPVAPLEEVRRRPGAVALTFDDGCRNFLLHAAPTLQHHGFPSTVFVVSDYCGGRNNWPSQPRNTGVPDLELMSWSELEEIQQAGAAIGCHTATHPHLPSLSEAEVERELSASRTAIEDRTGRPAAGFAYPYGESGPVARAVARRHFPWACGTRLGFLSASDDPYDLPRLDMYYLQHRFWFERFRSTLGATYLGARRVLRNVRQVASHLQSVAV